MDMAKGENSYWEERKFDPGNIIEFAEKKKRGSRKMKIIFHSLMFDPFFSSLANPLIIRLVVE